MEPVMVASSIKVIGSNGQISLGKKFAGRQVLVEAREPNALVGPKHLSKYGHIAGYDGAQWVSDFVQRDMWRGPYRNDSLAYQLFRYP
jgi:hypothetical protein